MWFRHGRHYTAKHGSGLAASSHARGRSMFRLKAEPTESIRNAQETELPEGGTHGKHEERGKDQNAEEIGRFRLQNEEEISRFRLQPERTRLNVAERPYSCEAGARSGWPDDRRRSGTGGRATVREWGQWPRAARSFVDRRVARVPRAGCRRVASFTI